MVKNTACVMWKPQTSNCHSVAQRMKKVCTVRASSTTNAPKSVVLPSLMCNGSVGVSHLIPYLLKHNQVRHSLTVMFLICMQCLSGKPAFGFSQSGTRIPPASRVPTMFHFALSSVLCSLKSLQRKMCQQKREQKREYSDKWE